MSNCEKFCLLCQNDQNVKVNFTLVHGLCIYHVYYNEESLECIHCGSVVPISLITNLNTEYQNSYSATLSGTFEQQNLENLSNVRNVISSSNQIIDVCEYCTEEKELYALECSHKICSGCASGGCQLCLILDHYECIPNAICEFCGLKTVNKESECGHKLCDECSRKKCELCEIPSRNLSIYDMQNEKCEYCLNAPSFTSCSQSHKLCANCFNGNCPLCSLNYSPKFNCESCSIHDFLSPCSNNHKLCQNCLENCQLCRYRLENSGTTNTSSPVTKIIIEKNDDSSSKYSIQQTRSIENKQKCQFCRKNQGYQGNFCSHMICKDCIYEHNKACEEDYKSSFNDTESVISIPENIDRKKSSIKVHTRYNSTSSKYELNKELEKTEAPSREQDLGSKNCKCQLI